MKIRIHAVAFATADTGALVAALFADDSRGLRQPASSSAQTDAPASRTDRRWRHPPCNVLRGRLGLHAHAEEDSQSVLPHTAFDDTILSRISPINRRPRTLACALAPRLLAARQCPFFFSHMAPFPGLVALAQLQGMGEANESAVCLRAWLAELEHSAGFSPAPCVPCVCAAVLSVPLILRRDAEHAPTAVSLAPYVVSRCCLHRPHDCSS